MSTETKSLDVARNRIGPAVTTSAQAKVRQAAPLRVVSFTHGGVQRATGRLRYEPLACHPELSLTVVVPEVWSEYGVTYRAEPPSGELDVRIAKVRWLRAGPAKWYLHHYRDMSRILRQCQPDVIHLWEEPWSLVALQALRLRDRLVPQAALVLETDQNILRRLPGPFEWMRRHALRHTDLLMVRGAEMEAVARACGYAGPTHTIAYGVDRTVFHPGASPRPAVASLVLGYVGRLIRAKGIFDVLDALAACAAPVRFELLGAGEDRAAFEAKARQLGLADRVAIHEPCPPEGVAAFMRRLDALVLMSRTLPTWKEQFGRVIIEAQACGVPVIGSSSGAIPDVVGPGGWVVAEGDAASLAKLFERLHADRPEVARVSAAGLNHVAHYSFGHVARQLLEAYRLAAAARHGAIQ